MWVCQIFWGTVSAGAGMAKPDWQAEWERTLEAAKKEGQLVVYTGSTNSIFVREFQKEYPEIKVVEGVRGSTAQRTQILLAERRANKFTADILLGSPDHTLVGSLVRNGIVDELRPNFILQEVVNQSGWFNGKHHYMDTGGKYFFMFEGNVRAADIAYNTSLVRSEEIRSYWDILDSRWKGKIVVPDPREARVRGITNSGLMLFYHHPEFGPGFIKRLFGDMDITLSRDYTQMMNWLGRGKVAFNFFSKDAEEARKQGLPVAEFPPSHFKEGGILTSSRGVIALVNRAPHPNAARVFINWVLSRKGQAIFQGMSTEAGSPSNSMREDIPKDVVPAPYRRVRGVRYLEATPEMHDVEPIMNLVKELLVKMEGSRP